MADNLPGFPDNLAHRGGELLAALYTIRNPQLDALRPHPFARRSLPRLPGFLWPQPVPYGLVAQIDPTGRPLLSLHDPLGERVRAITTAREHDGILYLGTLHDSWLARYALPLPFVPLGTPGEAP
jgi:hypothetical protein